MAISKEQEAKILRRLQTRTRLDENFDMIRMVLARKGVTLEMALMQLRKNKGKTEH